MQLTFEGHVQNLLGEANKVLHVEIADPRTHATMFGIVYNRINNTLHQEAILEQKRGAYISVHV